MQAVEATWHSMTDEDPSAAELAALDGLALRSVEMQAGQATSRFSDDNGAPLLSITFADFGFAHVGFIVRRPGSDDEEIIIVQKWAYR